MDLSLESTNGDLFLLLDFYRLERAPQYIQARNPTQPAAYKAEGQEAWVEQQLFGWKKTSAN